MAFLKDTESEQLRQLVKACLLEISKLKIELKKCQKETSKTNNENIKIKEFKDESNNRLEKKQEELSEKEAELNALRDLLNQKDEKIEELHKFKRYFDALTAKPKKDLTSFQFQIYQMLPDKEDTLENLYAYITEIGFSELSGENFEHVLYNLERKGYFQSYDREDEIFWKKIDK